MKDPAFTSDESQQAGTSSVITTLKRVREASLEFEEILNLSRFWEH
jgi:hypothetical protein